MNILVIGDLHCPFEKKGALKFVKKVYDKEDIDKVIFLGDVVDNHAMSYHESDPDGMSAGDELKQAIKHLGKWYKMFPDADVCIGNHDALPKRKGFTSGMSSVWIRSLQEVLKVPRWNFKPLLKYGDWFFSHGVGQSVHSRAVDVKAHCVAGHLHSKFEARFNGEHWSIFGGALVDDTSYAMAYGKFGKKTKHGVVVIKDALSDNPTVKMIKMKNYK